MLNSSDSPVISQKGEDPASLSTTEYIRSLTPTNKNKFYPIKGCQGLNIEVTPGGSKIYVLRYRFQAKQKIHTIGRFPGLKLKDAVAAAQIAVGKIAKGIDPNEEKITERRLAKEKAEPAYLVENLASDFLEFYVPDQLKPNSQYETKRYIEKFIIPTIGKLDVKLVTSPDIFLMVEALKATPVQANRLRAAASKMFNWGILYGKREVGTNPVSVVPNQPTNDPRTRRLTEAEVAEVGKTLKVIDEIEMAKFAIQIYLLTGMRKAELIGDKESEIEGLTWDRVHLDLGILMVYSKKRKKKKQLRPVYCSKAVIKLLKSIPKTEGNPYVITGRLAESSLVGIQDIWERIRAAAGLDPEIPHEEGPPTIHDLRRTYGSIAMDMGYKNWVPTLLGHEVKNVTEIYTRSELIQVMKVADAVGKRIDGLLRGTIRPLGHKRSSKPEKK